MVDFGTRLKQHSLTTVQSCLPSSFRELRAQQLNTSYSSPPKKSSPLDRLKRTLSFRNHKNEETCTSKTKNSTKPLQWQNDEKSVRVGTCSFSVKYLGNMEVQESRGIHVCEQSIQALLNQKSKHIKAILHISGDALRVVDEINKGLIVDQTIEKVSFCAPDRHHGKGFAYICRDGTTRRWLCHGFLAIKDTGERLSHTVGCAFQICLEQKQKRNNECNVTAEYTENGTSFTKIGSFRSTTITERLIDPQSALLAEPIPYKPINQENNVNERPRPRGNNSDAFIRSTSMRSNDPNQMIIKTCKQQETKYKNSIPHTIPEEVEVISTINEVSKLSLFDSTNSNHSSLPPIKSSIIPFSSTINNENLSSNFWFTNPTPPTSLNDAFNSNLDALIQSNQPINPFSPYGYSIAAQSQTPDKTSRQSFIFTPKRGTNPFDDDLIRR